MTLVQALERENAKGRIPALEYIIAQLREIAESHREFERTASPELRLFFAQMALNQMQFDYDQARREIAKLNAMMSERVYTGANGMHTFSSEEEARGVWDVLQFLRSKKTWGEWIANPQSHPPFPPDVEDKRQQRKQEEHRREFRASLARRGAIASADRAVTGGVNEALLQ